MAILGVLMPEMRKLRPFLIQGDFARAIPVASNKSICIENLSSKNKLSPHLSSNNARLSPVLKKAPKSAIAVKRIAKIKGEGK